MLAEWAPLESPIRKLSDRTSYRRLGMAAADITGQRGICLVEYPLLYESGICLCLGRNFKVSLLGSGPAR